MYNLYTVQLLTLGTVELAILGAEFPCVERSRFDNVHIRTGPEMALVSRPPLKTELERDIKYFSELYSKVHFVYSPCNFCIRVQRGALSDRPA